MLLGGGVVWFGGTDPVPLFCDPNRFVFVAIAFQNISCSSVKSEICHCSGNQFTCVCL